MNYKNTSTKPYLKEGDYCELYIYWAGKEGFICSNGALAFIIKLVIRNLGALYTNVLK